MLRQTYLRMFVNIGNRLKVWLTSHGWSGDISVDSDIRLLVADKIKLARLVITNTNPDSPGTRNGLQVSLSISST